MPHCKANQGSQDQRNYDSLDYGPERSSSAFQNRSAYDRLRKHPDDAGRFGDVGGGECANDQLPNSEKKDSTQQLQDRRRTEQLDPPSFPGSRDTGLGAGARPCHWRSCSLVHHRPNARHGVNRSSSARPSAIKPAPSRLMIKTVPNNAAASKFRPAVMIS